MQLCHCWASNLVYRRLCMKDFDINHWFGSTLSPPTDPFASLEPLNPSLDVSELFEICGSPSPKLRKSRSGLGHFGKESCQTLEIKSLNSTRYIGCYAELLMALALMILVLIC